jgi:hypothetical protein
MSKSQKGNKENKKPKADENRVKGVSAYKSAQNQAKPSSSRFGKKTWRKGDLGWGSRRVLMASIERFYSQSSSFDHEVTRILGAAFDMACALVCRSPQPTATRETIAKAIVEAATEGERDLHRLRDVGLAAVGHVGKVK